MKKQKDKLQFEYQNVMYDKLEDAEDAVAEYIGQDMNNIDPKSTEYFIDECFQYIEVYVNGEHYGTLEESLMIIDC